MGRIIVNSKLCGVIRVERDKFSTTLRTPVGAVPGTRIRRNQRMEGDCRSSTLVGAREAHYLLESTNGKCADQDPDGFLQKPFNMNGLMDKVGEDITARELIDTVIDKCIPEENAPRFNDIPHHLRYPSFSKSDLLGCYETSLGQSGVAKSQLPREGPSGRASVMFSSVSLILRGLRTDWVYPGDVLEIGRRGIEEEGREKPVEKKGKEKEGRKEVPTFN